MVTPNDAYGALAATLGERATLLGPLGPLTTYGVGGPAAVLVEVEGPADLDVVRAALHGWELPLFVLGRGSNLLVADAGFDGVVVHLGGGFAGLDLPRAAARAATRSSEPPIVRRERLWRSRCWLAASPMRDGRASPGPSACPDRSGVPFA